MFLLSSTEIAETVEETISENLISWANVRDYFVNYLPDIIDFILKLIIAVIILLIGARVIKFLRKLLRNWLEKSKIDDALKKFLDHLLNVAAWFILIMLVLGRFGVTASSVIAIIGSVGLSIGLALQGALSNFAGGVLILFLRPFSIGDYVHEDTSGNEGTVTDIALFYTTLVTVDNKTVIVPNANLTGSSLTNFTTQKKRMLECTVGVSYSSDIRQTKEVLYRTAADCRYRLDGEPINVFVSELADSSVNMGVRLWVAASDYFPAKWELTENIKLALDENGIQIPFPQMDVHMQKDTEV